MDGNPIVVEILDKSGLTKSALSAASGVSRSLIDDYLKGKSQPGVTQLRRLAVAAGCYVDITVHKNPELSSKVKQFEAVLEFGEQFPSKQHRPLVSLKPIWDAAAARERSAKAG